MKNGLAYFRHHLKNSLRTLLYIAVTSLLFSLIIGLNAQPQYRYTEHGREVYDYLSTLYLPVIVLCVLCYVVPILQLAPFKKRNNLDCYYALPLSRKAFATVRYSVGIALVYITFSLCYLQNFILLLIRGSEFFYFAPMIAHYFICLLIGFILYSFFSFVFQEANSTVDGIIFIGLYTFAFPLVAALLNRYFSRVPLFESSYQGFPWGVIDTVTTAYQRLTERSNALVDLWSDRGLVAWLIVWTVVGVFSAIGFFLSFGKRRTEKTGEISDSWFGYRVLIPLLALCSNFAVLSRILALILAFVGYTVYRRGFRYRISDFVVLGVLLLCVFVSL